MNSKKIRILSFQNAYNYGAILQAYGLQTVIKSLGFEDVKFINYNPKYLSHRYRVFLLSRFVPRSFCLKGIIGHYINLPFTLIGTIKRNRVMMGSIKRMLVQTTQKIVDIDGLKGIECDYIVCGSDQIWNTNLTKDFDKVYFGFGEYLGNPRIIAYAPSTELSSLTEKKLQQIKPLLENFDFLSVREVQVKNIFQLIVDKPIHLCVDPTILCGSEAYSEVAVLPNKSKEYVLVYAYDGLSKPIQLLIDSIPYKEELDVIYLTFGAGGYKTFYRNRFKAAVSVEEFLGYFKDAKYIVTNSFHGLAFSLLFHKNFNVAYEEKKSGRLLSLMEQVGLLNRFIKSRDDITWELIDYTNIDVKLDNLRRDSLKYLKQLFYHA